MSDDLNKRSLRELVSQPYKYGFYTDIENEEFPKGLD